MTLPTVILAVLSIVAHFASAQFNLGNRGGVPGFQNNGMMPGTGATGFQNNAMMPGFQGNGGFQNNPMLQRQGGFQNNGMMPGMGGGFQGNGMLPNAGGFQGNGMLRNGAGFQNNGMMQNAGGLLGMNRAGFQANALMPNNGQLGNIGMLANAAGRQQQQTPTFLTCIGRNTNGDEIRTTFYYEQRRRASQWNPWNPFNNQQSRTLRMFSLISTNINSQLQGEFQHVITEFSRVEDGCLSQALGDILTDRSWWGQNRVRGVIGTRTTVYQGQSARSMEVIDDLQMNDLIGRGLALCPITQLVGSTCRDLIPLCCKIGVDSQSATPESTQQQQQTGQFGLQNGLNTGLTNQNTGLNTGLNLNNGLNLNTGGLNLGGK